jgi:hypothetical protein
LSGHVDGEHDDGRLAVKLELLHRDLHVEQRPVLAAVPPDAARAVERRQPSDRIAQGVSVRRRPNIEDRQLEEFLARVPVLLDRCRVDSEEPQRLRVRHIHRVRVVLEEQLVLAL